MEDEIKDALSNAEAALTRDLEQNPLRIVVIASVVSAVLGYLLGFSMRR